MSSITNILIKSTPNTLPKRISAAEKINKRIKRPSDELAERESSEASSKFAQAVKQLPAYDVENLGFALMSNEDREALAITAITSSDKTKNASTVQIWVLHQEQIYVLHVNLDIQIAVVITVLLSFQHLFSILYSRR